MHLRTEIAFIASLAGLTACGIDCPHTVVDRSSTVPVDSASACSLATKTNGFTGTITDTQVCQQACNDITINECFLPYGYVQQVQQDPDGGVTCPPLPDGGTSIDLTCQVTHTEGTQSSGCPVAGRWPRGLERPARVLETSALGSYFAECALLEAAAVLAFERLARELRAHGAPFELVRAAESAAEDERRHARDVGRIAASFGAEPPAVDLPRGEVRSLFDIARENVIEGVVRETYGAALATFRATHAADGSIRDVERSLVADETAHAELSWALDAWVRAQLDAEQRLALDQARREAIAELRAALEREPDAVLVERAGVPGRAAALAMVDLLEQRVWQQAA